MKSNFAVALLALGACGTQPASQPVAQRTETIQQPSTQETERFIRKAAEEWAAVGVTGDTTPLQRILADDYVGVASSGEVRDKKTALARNSANPRFSESKVDYVNFRHFGDTVIAQGAETLKWRDGKPDLRLIWTDIWMFRNGQWQVVASQDSVRPPEASAKAPANG